MLLVHLILCTVCVYVYILVSLMAVLDKIYENV